MWFSRLSPGSDIQTLHLTPSSTQYSIGDIYSEYSMLCIPVSFEKRLEGFCLIGGGGELEPDLLEQSSLIGGEGEVEHKIWRHKAFEDINSIQSAIV